MPRSDPELKILKRQMNKVLDTTPDSADDIDAVQKKFDKLRADEAKFRQDAAKQFFNKKGLTYTDDMQWKANLLKKRREALLRRVAQLENEKATGKKPSTNKSKNGRKKGQGNTKKSQGNTKKSQGSHTVISKSKYGPGVNSMRNLNRTLRNARRSYNSKRTSDQSGRSGTYSSWTKL